jgi:tRNA-guanine family transglycosylase
MSSRSRPAAPIFAATVADDERLWPWTRGIHVDALLISYDILKLDARRLAQPLSKTLNSRVFTIVDSGGYGVSTETSATAVYKTQRAVGARLGIMLDRVVLSSQSPRTQKKAMDWTVRNAQLIKRKHRGTMELEGVIQGASPKQLAECGKRLATLQLDAYGVPLSAQSKYRRYSAALERIAHASSSLPPHARIHAMGCGSRTLMAILAAAGVTLFDSRSYYQRALYGENIESITMCALKRSTGSKECKTCMEKRSPGKTLQARTDYNLFEIGKEMSRIRCALRADAMDDYLQRRLKKKGELALLGKLQELKPLLGSRLRLRFS